MLLDPSFAWAAAAAPYAFTALGLVASLLLFASVKRDLADQNRKQTGALEQIAAQIGDAVARTEIETPRPAVAAAASPGFNMHRRVQAMRLLRHGEDIAHVAATLNVPRTEVELLIRVQQMVGVREAKTAES